MTPSRDPRDARPPAFAGLHPEDRPSRRELLRRWMVAGSGLLIAACIGEDEPPGPGRTFTPRPGQGEKVAALDTRWPIKRVIYLMMENRSYDNLFGRFPSGRGATVGVSDGKEIPIARCPEWLPGDLPHDYVSATAQMNGGKMDGFALGKYGQHYAYSQFGREEIPNYWHWAENYVLCDNVFASALGPSYPNHLYFVAGDAGGVIDNPENIETLRESDLVFKSWGCDAVGEDVFVLVRDQVGNLTKHPTCFRFPTVGEQLGEHRVDWAYYAATPDQFGYIWNAYSAFENVFGTDLWDRHIRPVDRLVADIERDALPSVTWITPRFEISDHPPWSTGHAHNWVTDVVNAVMRSPGWEHTAIFITWDEWGGFYDHVAPPSLLGQPLGIRVPMLVVSPYARKGYVDDALGEFSTPLAFVSDNWGMPYLNDRIGATHNFEHVFDFDKPPRPPDPMPRSRIADGEPFRWIGHSDEWPDFIDPVTDPL